MESQKSIPVNLSLYVNFLFLTLIILFVFSIFVLLSWKAVAKTEWNTDMFIKDLLQLYLITKETSFFCVIFHTFQHCNAFCFSRNWVKTYTQGKLQKCWDPIVSLFHVQNSLNHWNQYSLKLWQPLKQMRWYLVFDSSACFFYFRGVASSRQIGLGLVLLHSDLGWIFKQVGFFLCSCNKHKTTSFEIAWIGALCMQIL